MSYLTATTIIGWQTRNVKRYQKAIIWCKDYGLLPILANVFIGNLYLKEEKSLLTKLNRTFNRKTDKVFLIKVCQSCYSNIDLDTITKQKLNSIPEFELIQIPLSTAISPRRGKKASKHWLLHNSVV